MVLDEITRTHSEKTTSSAHFPKLVRAIAWSLTRLGVFDIRLRKNMDPTTAVNTTLSYWLVDQIHTKVDIDSGSFPRSTGKQTTQEEIASIEQTLKILKASLADASWSKSILINKEIRRQRGKRGYLKSQLKK